MANKPLNSDIMRKYMTSKPASKDDTCAESAQVSEDRRPASNTAHLLDTNDSDRIIEIPLDLIDPFEGHIFSVKDDDREMRILMSSIKAEGQQQPVILRKKNDGRYELISGHRRCRALELLGHKTVRAVISIITSDILAELIMMDTNASARDIPPTERGEMYKRRMNILRELDRNDDVITWERLKLHEEEEKYSRRSIYNYISLTKLTPEWKNLIDNENVPMTVGIILSDLSEPDQRALYSDLSGNYQISISQANRIKEMCKNAEYNSQEVLSILNRVERLERPFKKISLSKDEIPSYYINNCSQGEIKSAMIKDSVSWRALITSLGLEFAGKSNEEALAEVIQRLSGK